MSDYIFAPPPQPYAPVRGGGRFAVRRIYCVGRNYAEHAREMGHVPGREPPFFFDKPADALVISGAGVPYPPETSDLHHEIELVVAIGGEARDLAPEAVPGVIYGYAVGIDLTRRDLQAAAKKAGKPWDLSKGFDASAPIGEIVPAAQIGHPKAGKISLAVNDTLRQSADIADMIWSVPEAVAALSRSVTLRPGDLLFTGTPAGVAALARGDRLAGTIDGIGRVDTTIL
jgi:fumarylpyruvate hydrolase